MGEEYKALVRLMRKVLLIWEAHRWSRKARRLLCEYPSLAEMAMAEADAIIKMI